MDNPLIILVVILVVAAVVALVAYVLYRVLRPRLKEEKPTEEQILEDEMNRVLQDVEDEEVAKQIND